MILGVFTNWVWPGWALRLC